jgi:glc operon protein GlcG
MADTIASRSISLDGARRVIDAAVAKAAAEGWQMCIVVADPAGLPVMTVRMDGAPRMSGDIAANKAYSVASFKGMPTDRWWPAISNDPALVHGITHTPRLTIFAGGVPLTVNGELIGAVGVSGGSAEQDGEVALVAAAVL